MKKPKKPVIGGICSSIINATEKYWKRFEKVLMAVAPFIENYVPKCSEWVFIKEWTTVLMENSNIFNGIYSGLARVQRGNAKKPEKVLREWCQRTHYKFEEQPVDLLCREHIIPLIDAADKNGLLKWTGLLLDAAAAAGISRDETVKLVLTEANADAYVEWDGNDLYPEDEIEVISPAWYQNGKVLEQGQCRKVNVENTGKETEG